MNVNSIVKCVRLHFAENRLPGSMRMLDVGVVVVIIVVVPILVVLVS